MKAVAVLFALLAVSVSSDTNSAVRASIVEGLPEGDVIRGLIAFMDRWSQSIRDAGLDPMYIERTEAEWSHPLLPFCSAKTVFDRVFSNGLATYVINTLRFPFLTSRLLVDIEIPRVEFIVGNANTEFSLLGESYSGEFSGRVVISRIRLVGEVRFRNRIFSANTVRSIEMDLSVAGIQSDLRASILDSDISAEVNNFFSNTLLAEFNSRKPMINQYVEKRLLEVIEIVM